MSVYFVRNTVTGNVKIGFTADEDARKRFADIQGATDCDLELLAVIPWAGRPMEARLHIVFAKYRLRGEWFASSKALELLIENACEGRLNDSVDLPCVKITPDLRRWAMAKRIVSGWSVAQVAAYLGVDEGELGRTSVGSLPE